MAIDLFSNLTEDIARPIRAQLASLEIDQDVPLAPPTRDGAGDLALACHRYARFFRKAPQVIAEELSACIIDHPLVDSVRAEGGFLNIDLNWGIVAQRTLDWAMTDDGALGRSNVLSGQRIMVEYSSPNTNKPLHLGHCRNNLLGQTVAEILAAAGADVIRVNLINDRGIHICKSMVAYQLYGDGRTPEQEGKKSDHFIGEFYVLFNSRFVEEYATWKETAGEELDKDQYFNSTHSELGRRTREMLVAWENGDESVRDLWRLMNGWCESGFQQTYDRMGVRFDHIDHESKTYLLGKDLINEGVNKGVFTKAENGATVFDLERIGLEGQKVVLRSDGTSVYVTQDIGTAIQRFETYNFDRLIYVVGNEQEHHFRVLFGILKTLRPELDGRLHHLSYGMVELPDGKMKSREGTVVDADEMMDQLHDAAVEAGRERWPDLDDHARHERGEAIALGGLKFFFLKYAPPTTFVFDRERSISYEGETGAYCQYAYTRATSILRKLADADVGVEADYSGLDNEQSRDLLRAMLGFPGELKQAAFDFKPSLLAKGTYEIAKAFAAFYNHRDCRVMGVEPGIMAARARLVRGARRMLAGGLELLGMAPLEEM